MAGRPARTRYAVGMMTGTSLDGLDAALVALTGRGKLLKASFVRHRSQSLDGLTVALRRAATQQPMTTGRLARLAHEFGQLHIEAVTDLLGEEHDASDLALIAVHGQTVFHEPPLSWQLIDVAPLACAAGCPVVFDLRQADLAAGGQGAPITPLADWIMFRHATKRRAIVNLGGFCNMTVLPAGRASQKKQVHESIRQIEGSDVCTCNQILDAVARNALGQPYDEDGRAAQAGSVNEHAASLLLDALREQHTSRRSLGTEDAVLAWIDEEAGRLEANDLAATAAMGVGRCIGMALQEHEVDEIILAGGGVRHVVLKKSIADSCNAPCRLCDEIGVPAEAREAMAMAVLGALCADGVPITLPHITGCSDPAPVAGVWMNPP